MDWIQNDMEEKTGIRPGVGGGTYRGRNRWEISHAPYTHFINPLYTVHIHLVCVIHTRFIHTYTRYTYIHVCEGENGGKTCMK